MKIVSIVKAVIGMNKWKKRMKKLDSAPCYTPEWWKECEDSIEFMAPEQRKAFLDRYVGLMLGF